MCDQRPTPSRLRPGQIARLAQISVETVRYYERLGLLPASTRTGGGQRQYTAESLTAIRVVHALQRLGYSLSDVAELVAAVKEPSSWRTQRQSRLADLDDRLADLEAIRGALACDLQGFPASLPSQRKD